MAWQIVRNKNYTSRETYHRGDCKRFNEIATLSIHLSGKQMCKSDLQPTFSCRLDECSLLKEKNERDTTCMMECSLLKDYKKSHDY